jgi:uncharacterized membrane protein YraQ (UPF0718 family)
MKQLGFTILQESGGLLLTILPSVLAGCFVSAILLKKKWSIFNNKSLYMKHPAAIFSASLLGAISPVCTIGTIPVIAGLIKNGMSVGIAVSFIIASSIITPQMVIIGFSTVGWRITLVQVLSGLLAANLLGFLSLLLGNKKIFNALLYNKKEENSSFGIDFSKGIIHKSSSKNSIMTLFLNQLDFILPYLAGGVLLAAVIKALLPESFLSNFIGQANFLYIVFSSLISIPAYICGGASLSFLGSMSQIGFPPGMIVAFIIAGPATRIQNLVVFNSLIKKKFIILFTLFILVYASVIGVLYSNIST